MTVYSEVASILEEELAGVAPIRLDVSRCALMSFDHWPPEDLHGADPAEVIRDLDTHDLASLCVAPEAVSA